MNYIIINKSNYAGKTLCKNYNAAIKFYTKKQMKTIYPNKNFRVVGEINNNTGVQCGVVELLDRNPLPVYKEKTHNKLTESIAGYAGVDDHTYLVVVKNVLIQRIVIMIFIIIVLLIVYTNIYLS